MSSTDSPQQVSRGLLITLGVVVGLAALYALYTFVISPLLADDPEPDVVATAPDEPADDVDPADPGATPEPGVTDGGTEPDLEALDVVPETFEIFTARDPFQQLVVEAPAAASSPTQGTIDDNVGDGGTDGTDGGDNGGDGGGTDGSMGGTDGTDGSDGTDGEMGNGNGSSGGTGGETAPPSANVGSTTISLTDVFVAADGEPVLQVSVNGQVYEVREGDVFAERFRVLNIDGVCATFLFGDSRFTLCEGESIVK